MTTFETQKGKLSYLYNKTEKNKFDVERLNKMEVVKRSIVFNKNRQEVILLDKVYGGLEFLYQFENLNEDQVHWVKPLFLITTASETMTLEIATQFLNEYSWQSNYFWQKPIEGNGMILIGSIWGADMYEPMLITIKFQVINPQVFEGFRGKQ